MRFEAMAPTVFGSLQAPFRSADARYSDHMRLGEAMRRASITDSREFICLL